MARFDRRLLILASLLAGLCVVLAAYWIAGRRADEGKRQSAVLMSSIALRWGEGDLKAVTQGETQPDPLFLRLGENRDLQAVDNVEQLQASRADIAILIQPRPFAAEELVRLDDWVRAGGRLLFFADPALQWPSSLPMGDPNRPLFTSMHSPLFAHWGLELVLPMDSESAAATQQAQFGAEMISMVAPGNWQLFAGKAAATGRCRISANRIVAECRPGKGQVLLVSDADLLHHELWRSTITGTDNSANLLWTERLISVLSEGTRYVGSQGEIMGN